MDVDKENVGSAGDSVVEGKTAAAVRSKGVSADDNREAFSPDLLRIYYARLFPYEQVCRCVRSRPVPRVCGIRKRERESMGQRGTAVYSAVSPCYGYREFGSRLLLCCCCGYAAFATGSKFLISNFNREITTCSCVSKLEIRI